MMIDQTQLISSAFPLIGGGAIGRNKKTYETSVHRAWPGNAGTGIL